MAFSLMCIVTAASLFCVETRQDEIVTTRHQIRVDGRTMAYTAKAGKIPIRDNETGDIHAYMFFTAYTLDSDPDHGLRPLTFL
ncbi:MAG: hypothetical protein JXB23_11695, partial [Candidatus Aminicenantes bacterium]|nr:hypothetical protein [Candidatus Aminicenantes bacterium]